MSHYCQSYRAPFAEKMNLNLCVSHGYRVVLKVLFVVFVCLFVGLFACLFVILIRALVVKIYET